MKEIKTCPFCGSKAEVYEECEMIKIRCSRYMCQASIMNWHDEVEDAIEAWNKRATKTKQIKYYDEDENVWKIGEVIVDGEREGE